MKVNPLLFLFLVPIFSIHNAKSEDNQYIPTTVSQVSFDNSADLIWAFCAPLTFTRSGIKGFLEKTFSRSEYANDFLPHSFCHLIEFLEYGNKNHQGLLYTHSTFRLFTNKLKACSYVSAEALLVLLERIPLLIEMSMVQPPSSWFEETKSAIKRILYNSFLTKFNDFKANPDDFFEGISAETVSMVQTSSLIHAEITREQCRQAFIKFLEIALNKVMWSPLDQANVWDNVKKNSQQLVKLHEVDVLNQDELDDLFQSLLERFIHFLDLSGSDLPLSLIEAINHDIEEGKLLFLTLEEQEEFLMSKASRLQKALEQVRIKILAKGHGIVA